MASTFNEPDSAWVQQLLRNMVNRRVAVIGDVMVDDYVIGSIDRISPEAPVPVLNVHREELMLGGAANVAKCLVALGARVRLCGIVGNDADGALFRAEANSLGITTTGVIADPTRPTTRKTRIVAQKQQVIRLDREDSTALSAEIERKLISHIQKAAKWADGIIISDYAKGVLTERVCKAAIQAAGAKPVLVDPKKLPWARYRGATIIKPNSIETETCSGQPIHDDTTAGKAARKIGKDLSIQHVLVTRGSRGMTLASHAAGSQSRAAKKSSNTSAARGRLTHFAAQPRDLIDVTGAGDVVAATLLAALTAGADVEQATWLSNLAAGIKVSKFGAATVTGQELLEMVGSGGGDLDRKDMTRSQAAAFARKTQKRGRKVVFTNGCFDILHVGHVTYLERSRKLGDALIVGINTDASVRKLKGPGRPVQSETDRAHIVASLSCVDAVVLFDDDTPMGLIQAIKPDILTKGADYKKKQNVVGWEMVEKQGGRVVLVDLIKGRSTTSLIEKSKK